MMLCHVVDHYIKNHIDYDLMVWLCHRIHDHWSGWSWQSWWVDDENQIMKIRSWQWSWQLSETDYWSKGEVTDITPAALHRWTIDSNWPRFPDLQKVYCFNKWVRIQLCLDLWGPILSSLKYLCLKISCFLKWNLYLTFNQLSIFHYNGQSIQINFNSKRCKFN